CACCERLLPFGGRAGRRVSRTLFPLPRLTLRSSRNPPGKPVERRTHDEEQGSEAGADAGSARAAERGRPVRDGEGAAVGEGLDRATVAEVRGVAGDDRVVASAGPRGARSGLAGRERKLDAREGA